MIPNLWEATLEIKQKYFSDVILASNITVNRLLDNSSAQSEWGDWWRIVCDLESIIILVLIDRIQSHFQKHTPL